MIHYTRRFTAAAAAAATVNRYRIEPGRGRMCSAHNNNIRLAQNTHECVNRVYIILYYIMYTLVDVKDLNTRLNVYG